MNEEHNFQLGQESKTSFDKLAQQMSHIKGWGIDANPKNDPTYPMRQRSNDDRSGYDWPRPTQQPDTQHVLKSNERPDLPSVFGTSAPAPLLSGAIRRYAFRFSEGRYRHWLLLLLADRVNMIEGLVSDVASGRLPHCMDERGLNAELKYNRKAVVTRVAVGAVVLSSLAIFLAYRKPR